MTADELELKVSELAAEIAALGCRWLLSIAEFDHREAYLKRGLSQEQLALECGLDPSEIGHLERAVRDPRLATIARVAKGLGVPAADLLKGV